MTVRDAEIRRLRFRSLREAAGRTTAAAAIDLMANPKKTKVMTFNSPSKIDIKTSDGSILEEVDDFTYLGSLVSSSRADIAKRIGLAWAAHNKMSIIWRSTLSRKTKTRLFRSTVESVFLYGSAAMRNIFKIWEYTNCCEPSHDKYDYVKSILSEKLDVNTGVHLQS